MSYLHMGQKKSNNKGEYALSTRAIPQCHILIQISNANTPSHTMVQRRVCLCAAVQYNRIYRLGRRMNSVPRAALFRRVHTKPCVHGEDSK